MEVRAIGQAFARGGSVQERRRKLDSLDFDGDVIETELCP